MQSVLSPRDVTKSYLLKRSRCIISCVSITRYQLYFVKILKICFCFGILVFSIPSFPPFWRSVLFFFSQRERPRHQELIDFQRRCGTGYELESLLMSSLMVTPSQRSRHRDTVMAITHDDATRRVEAHAEGEQISLLKRLFVRLTSEPRKTRETTATRSRRAPAR